MMQVVVSQQSEKLLITLKSGKLVDKYRVDKADEFINVVDKFLKKSKMKIESLQKADLEFVNTGMLTERIIRSIMLGLQLFIL